LKEIVSQGLEAISEKDRDTILNKYIEEAEEAEPQQQKIKATTNNNNKNGGNKK
jgi:hypothetical protein